MQRTIRWVALGAAVCALAACSHHQPANAPLSYVPANTPYLIANLKPLTSEIRSELRPTAIAKMSMSMRVMQLHDSAKKLADSGKSHLANVLNTVADSADGKTPVQMATSIGVDPDGLFALYGLGLSPVLRGQLADPAKFHAYIAKLEKAYGQPFSKATQDKRSYQHVTLGKSGLQLVIAAHDKHFTLAILPAKASTHQLGLALGLVHPEHSIASTQRLSKLAKAEGYGPYLLAYLDTTKLPALLAGAHDPLAHALVNKLGGKNAAAKLSKEFPASCKSDLARIAARVPMMSFGYTYLSNDEQKQQADIRFAPDIVKAFKGIGTHVPGLGQDSNAPLNLALALPIPTLRDFGLAQAEAVAAHPFTCPALKGLNKTFAKLQKALPKASMPPLGGLRGIHLVIDTFDTAMFNGSAKSKTDAPLDARFLIASQNPTGLLNMAKAMLPGAAQLNVKNDGTPVALPAASTAKYAHGQPTWLAMGKQSVALGIGKGEKDKLTAMVEATGGEPGTLFSMHMSGKIYAQWMKSMSGALAKVQAMHASEHAGDAKEKKDIADTKAKLDAVAKAMQSMQGMRSHAQFTNQGLRISSDVHWKKK